MASIETSPQESLTVGVRSASSPRYDSFAVSRTAPLRVLYVMSRGDMGGVQRFLDSLVVNHTTSRVDPVVLAFQSGPWLEALKRRGVTVCCLEGMRLSRPVSCFRRISDVLSSHRIDIVHCAYAWCHAVVAPAAIRYGCRRVWMHHGPLGPRRWQGIEPLIPADLLLANSNRLLSQLQGTFHWARRTGVIHYGIDSNEFAPSAERREAFRRSFGIRDDQLAVGIVGFLDTWKGQDVFVRAASLLRNEKKRLRMFVIGGPRDGLVDARCRAFERQLHEYVKEQSLADIVTFTGHLDVQQGALDGLDVLVHASTAPEPFGMVILEAMAKGKAIVASREGGPAEILDPDVTGILIEPRSAPVLARCLQNVLDYPSRCRQLGEAARYVAVTRFHPRIPAEHLESWYERLMG